ncbi:hypothetical protein QYE76_036225 [Lolium multiflorum]|uniref:Ribonuclease H n=1 Tax=Lolium multiflorum TaxID=4521 RepID=A0AAD8R2D7_LOLMU|nr:hypothetical protein QYE76_036225 [Lolium multiflorum]
MGPTPAYGVGPPCLLRLCPSAYLNSPSRNPITESHDTKVPETPPPPIPSWGIQEILGTLPERGIIAGGLYITMIASGLMFHVGAGIPGVAPHYTPSPTTFTWPSYPADLMFIRYEDIFRLLNMQQLDRNLVRLLSLSMAHDIAMENTADIAIMDPFYMTPTVVQNEQAFLAKYIKDFLVLNKDKKCFAIPYFREFKYCTLLLFHPYHSHVSYLDSGLDPDKDFTDLKSTLDKALSGFIAEVGIDKIRHEKKVKGCYVCNHITKFPCLKQSAHDNGMEAWFAILQMRSIVRSQNDLLLPSSLQRMFVNMADTTDENMTYYVVYHGRVPGVYEDWEDCRRQVHRFSGNSYKGYTTLEEAETRYANFRAGQRREMWRTPFIVMMLAATVSLVYYVIVV